MKRLWTCEVCGKPIRHGSGYVTVSAIDGGWPYPREKKVKKPKLPGLRSAAERLAAGEYELRVLNVKFAVMHSACDPKPDSGEYWFGVEEASTLEAFMRWVNHIGGKDWTGKREVLAFIAFWFENRGIRWDTEE